jgi:hypothetical protein
LCLPFGLLFLLPQVREKAIADQFEARRAKNKATRERKAARREERLSSVSCLWFGEGSAEGSGSARLQITVWQQYMPVQEPFSSSSAVRGCHVHCVAVSSSASSAGQHLASKLHCAGSSGSNSTSVAVMCQL